ncbi:histone deacetylase [Halostreptopolyspora alba]|uniref:Histone deacetylase n=1 Tax=Halostreptopolyspora alba TaxID=2487137 RepID=A0A3N0EGN2_9ACTN|nr:histone deacetylase [Nocardiopsaceae bacterium YIM 96095]
MTWNRPELLWYASFGANMSGERLSCYVEGGTPPGGSRPNPGCRDRTPPRAHRAIWLNGGTYFALTSPMWGGGLAIHDPGLPGAAPARAYLVTAGQFGDIAAQEMYREAGGDLDLTRVLRDGRDVRGDGRYETLLYCGDIAGYPVVSFTAHWSLAEATVTVPSEAYLRVIGAGLREAHAWSIERTAAHLAQRPGAAGHWSVTDVAALLRADRDVKHASGTHHPTTPIR